MGYAYKITDQQGLYYVTFTGKDWVDIFTRNEYSFIITHSLNCGIKQKGLEVYAWVLMTNYLHAILSSSKDDLSVLYAFINTKSWVIDKRKYN